MKLRNLFLRFKNEINAENHSCISAEVGHQGAGAPPPGPAPQARRVPPPRPLRGVHPLRPPLAAAAASEGRHVQEQAQARPQPCQHGPEVSLAK